MLHTSTYVLESLPLVANSCVVSDRILCPGKGPKASNLARAKALILYVLAISGMMAVEMTIVQAPPAELYPIQFETLKAGRWIAARHSEALRPVDCQSVSTILSTMSGELPKAAR